MISISGFLFVAKRKYERYNDATNTHRALFVTQSATQCRVVSQSGTVAAIRGNYAYIDVQQQSACGSCTLRGVCTPGSGTTRRVRARVDSTVATGQSVLIELDLSKARFGVFLGYVAPLLLVVATLFATLPFVERQAFAGLAAWGVLVPYYGTLYGARGFVERIIEMRAVPMQKDGAV